MVVSIYYLFNKYYNEKYYYKIGNSYVIEKLSFDYELFPVLINIKFQIFRIDRKFGIIRMNHAHASHISIIKYEKLKKINSK